MISTFFSRYSKFLFVSAFVFFIFFSLPETAFLRGLTPDTSTYVASSTLESANAGDSCGINPICYLTGAGGAVLGFVLNLIIDVANFIFGWLFRGINSLLLYLVWLSGVIMDLMIYYTVVQFTSTFTQLPDSSGGVANGGLIYYFWSFFRDLLNAGIFFIIIYHAIMSMFNGFADVRKKFTALLVFVVLVNFSLLFVKLVIDISNIATLTIYTSVVQPSGSSTFTEFTTPSNPDGHTSLSNFIISSIGATADKNSAPGKDLFEAAADAIDPGSAVYQLARMIMYIFLFFFFIYVAGIFLARAAMFIVIMIMSPLLVAGSFFDAFKKQQDWLRGELTEEALQAPALVLFIVISSLIAFSIFSNNGNNFDSLNYGQLNILIFIKVVFFFVFNVIGFKAVREATSRGGYLSEKITGLALAGTIGGAGLLGRKTIGAGAGWAERKMGSNLRDKIALAQTDEEKGALATQYANSFRYRVANAATNTTFDARNLMEKKIPGLGISAMTATQRYMGFRPDLGTASTETIKSVKAKKDEKAGERRENLIASMVGDDKKRRNVTDKDLKVKVGSTEYGLDDVYNIIESVGNDSLSDKINGAENDGSKIVHNGVTHTKAEWNKLVKSTSGAGRSALVTDFLDDRKDAAKDAMYLAESVGGPNYAMEIPRRLARAGWRTVTGEDRDGGDFRMQKEYASKLAKLRSSSDAEYAPLKSLSADTAQALKLMEASNAKRDKLLQDISNKTLESSDSILDFVRKVQIPKSGEGVSDVISQAFTKLEKFSEFQTNASDITDNMRVDLENSIKTAFGYLNSDVVKTKFTDTTTKDFRKVREVAGQVININQTINSAPSFEPGKIDEMAKKIKAFNSEFVGKEKGKGKKVDADKLKEMESFISSFVDKIQEAKGVDTSIISSAANLSSNAGKRAEQFTNIKTSAKKDEDAKKEKKNADKK